MAITVTDTEKVSATPVEVVKEAPLPQKKLQPLTREQVLALSDPDKLCLIIIGQTVYDATRWQHRHPGGHLTIRALCGKDATDAFSSSHDDFVKNKMLKGFYYADLKADAKEDKVGIAFRELTRKFEEAGLYKTNYNFYYKKAVVYSLMFASVVAGVTMSESMWVHAMAGVMLGMFWQQVAFLGHDIGHNSVTRSRTLDSYWGLFVGNFLTGISIGWWKRSHNVHHIVTNSAEHDPDIQHLPIFAPSPIYLKTPIFSTFFEHYLPLDSSAHFLVKFQHFLYYPVMAFARFNLYVQSLTHATGTGAYSINEVLFRRDLQILTLAGFWVWLITLTMQLPTWPSRVLFFLLAHNVAGLLHVQILLSHYYMPIYSGITYDTHENGFVNTQLQHSLDIDCPVWMDWFHGGLQFQVEHHLWPKLPRHSYRTVKPILIAFCKEHGLEYHQETFFKANCNMISHLKETSKSARSFNQIFRDALNLSG
eukprot:CAMPEP_0117044088 /NCGR_PEP_ID=MMETSP0472-20121206/30583_1 /TAXON_ID=693140 ORGANISM="Tiarina fusus, Strain LIS" /NCGR_SAMPLE_ID=MMETSP0472 /ASSEMBLY_ACC=CAM_ASM_000603 /LENGTH=478 /DNA_ID=CAMNT_0004755737 /DNA_START=157 /DNA_END=1593 /DNA_ORIENTATION=-